MVAVGIWTLKANRLGPSPPCCTPLLLVPVQRTGEDFGKRRLRHTCLWHTVGALSDNGAVVG